MRVLFVALVISLSATFTLTAGPLLTTQSFVDFNVANGDLTTATILCNSPGSCTGTAAVPGTALQMRYSASSSSTFGVLKAYAAQTIEAASTRDAGKIPDHSVVRGLAGFEDIYTFLGSAPGVRGSATFTYTVTGAAISSSPHNKAIGYVDFYVPQTKQDYQGSVDKRGFATSGSIPITFGQPLDLITMFNAGTNTFDFAAGDFEIADYAHTATLTGISALDASGQAVPFTIDSVSKTRYTSSGVVPEPSTLWLLGPLTAAFALWRVRRYPTAS